MNSNFLHDIKTRPDGKEWLDGLPNLIKHFEKEWNVKASKPFDLSYNYVAPAIRGDEDVVLKIVFPGNGRFISEISALKAYNGNGSIKLL